MKTVIITGSSRGIGLETALTFGRAGYKVFATMRHPAGATDLKQKIKEESLQIFLSEMDVNSDESVINAFFAILRENESIDVLVNNAGIERHGSIEELPMADFKDVMETNYFGAIRCIQSILPQMRKNGRGCIINVSSISGRLTTSPLGSYSSSKFALEAISEALAQEVKPYNIRVGIVEPGIIDTDMAHKIMEEDKSIYPNSKRMADLFTASLKTPTSPSIVAEKILEIADSETWKLRHPVGPDAIPFIGWRASMTDEEWINWNSASDEEWYDAVERDFGMNARRNYSSG